MSNKKNNKGQLWVRILCIVLCAMMCIGSIVLIVESMKSTAAKSAEIAEPTTEISVGIAYGDEVYSAFSMCNPGGFSVSLSDAFEQNETSLFSTDCRKLAFAVSENLYKPAEGDGYNGYNSDPSYSTLIGAYHVQITSFSSRVGDAGSDNPVPIFPGSGSSQNPEQSGYSYSQAINRMNDLAALKLFDDSIDVYPVCLGEKYGLRIGNFDTKEKASAFLEDLQKSLTMRAEIAQPKDGSVSMIDYEKDRVLLAIDTECAMRLCVRPLTSDDFSCITGESYYGCALVSSENGGIGVVNRLKLEDYVRCTLPTVVSSYDPLEMRKAFAVVLRTNALARIGSHSAQGFDFCASGDHCIDYCGRKFEDILVSEAVLATKGQYLTFGGKPINALYAHSGAATTSDSNGVFGIDCAYLTVSGNLPPSSETKIVVLSPYDVYQILSDAGYDQIKANVKNVVCKTIPDSSYVSEISFTDILGNELTVTGGREILRVFGGQLDSLSFTCQISSDAQTPGFFVFAETGVGNGLGITLAGARSAASLGNDYKAILSMYYKQLTLAG